jgi:AcrR family transcriptional regulator
VSTARERVRQDMMQRIVAAARRLLVAHGEVSLRAVAGELEMTPPALYRYVASHEDLIRTVALEIDRDAARRIEKIRRSQPADDPAGQLIAAATAFRRWALDNRTEFSLVFTNVDVNCAEELGSQSATGMLFSELFVQLWHKYQFGYPAIEDLDPRLAEILLDPMVPADLSEVPPEMRGLVWLLQRAWAALYGAVTLEVYEHVDARLVEQGWLFRAMVEDQCHRLALDDEVPRLLAVVDSLLG